MAEPSRQFQFEPDEAEPFLPRGEFPGSELLAGESPREVLERIADGDPLGMAARCRERIAARALLVAAHRVTPRALAYVARHAMTYRGEPELPRWLEHQIDRALASCQEQDREEERAGLAPVAAHYAYARDALGVVPELARAACIAFNALPSAVRRAWWALGVEGKSVNRYVAEGHGSRELIDERVIRALITLGTLSDPGGPDEHDREEPLP